MEVSRQLTQAIHEYRQQNRGYEPDKIIIAPETLDELKSEVKIIFQIDPSKDGLKFRGISLEPLGIPEGFELISFKKCVEDLDLFNLWAECEGYDNFALSSWLVFKRAHAAFLNDMNQWSFNFQRALRKKYSLTK